MTLNDPNVRKTLARLKWVARDMKREDRLLIHGRQYTNSAATDIAKTFARYDYVAPSLAREA